ncbi:C3a anaphylatoxin chemotactic receptor-like [Pelobates fuscus]|uniref:C3a anaphylatoxin chemotactic receptor-like n=1 Tax=Pelobates fuscus TaxID=191477 RepID=UPI002FE448F8
MDSETNLTMDMNMVNKICLSLMDVLFDPASRDLVSSNDNPSAIKYSSFVLSIITCILGLVGNTVVIIVIGFVMKTFKSRIWFLNLAVADLMFLLVLPLNAVSVLRANWSYGNHICKMYNFLSIVNIYASIFLITALTIDRLLSVVKPIWHHMFYSPRVCYCVCAFIWVVTVLCSIPVILYSNEFEDDGSKICSLFPSDIHRLTILSQYTNDIVFPEYALKDIEETCFDYISDDNEFKEVLEIWTGIVSSTRSILIPLLIIGYCIPLCVILCSNVAIALKVKTSKHIRSSKLYGIVVAAIIAFFLTQTPLVIAQFFLLTAIQNINFSSIFKIVSLSPLLSSIAYLNCCLNPIIYVFLGSEVMAVFTNILNRVRQRFTTRSSSVPNTPIIIQLSPC